MNTVDISKQEAADEAVNEFIQKFRAKFGVTPRVLYSFNRNIFRVTLDELEEVANYLISSDPLIIAEGANMRLKYRQRELVLYRHCAFKILKRMGYGCSIIGDHFGWDHATVIHGNKTVDNLISISDYQTLNVLTKFEDELQKRFGINGNPQLDNASRIDA